MTSQERKMKELRNAHIDEADYLVIDFETTGRLLEGLQPSRKAEPGSAIHR